MNFILGESLTTDSLPFVIIWLLIRKREQKVLQKSEIDYIGQLKRGYTSTCDVIFF